MIFELKILKMIARPNNAQSREKLEARFVGLIVIHEI